MVPITTTWAPTIYIPKNTEGGKMVTIRIGKFQSKITGPANEIMEISNYLRVFGLSSLLNDMQCKDGDYLYISQKTGQHINVRFV